MTEYHFTGTNSDDTAAVHNLALSASNEGGGVIILHGMVYVNQLVIPGGYGAGVSLRGDGMDGTEIRATHTATSFLVRTEGYGSVQDLYINGFNRPVICLNVAGGRTYLNNIYTQGTVDGGGILVSHSGSIQAGSIRSGNHTGGIAFEQAGSASPDGEYGQLWVHQAEIGARFQNGAQQFSTLHSWGNRTYGVVLDGASCNIGTAYIETNGLTTGHAGMLLTSSDATVAAGDFAKNGGPGITVAPGSKGHSIVGCSFRENGRFEGAPGLMNHGTEVGVMGCGFFDRRSSPTQTYAIEESPASDYNVYVGNRMRRVNHRDGTLRLYGVNNKKSKNIR